MLLCTWYIYTRYVAGVKGSKFVKKSYRFKSTDFVEKVHISHKRYSLHLHDTRKALTVIGRQGQGYAMVVLLLAYVSVCLSVVAAVDHGP